MCFCKNELISVTFEDSKAVTMNTTVFWEGASSEQQPVAQCPPGTGVKGDYTSDKLHDVTQGSAGQDPCACRFSKCHREGTAPLVQQPQQQIKRGQLYGQAALSVVRNTEGFGLRTRGEGFERENCIISGIGKPEVVNLYQVECPNCLQIIREF